MKLETLDANETTLVLNFLKEATMSLQVIEDVKAKQAEQDERLAAIDALIASLPTVPAGLQEAIDELKAGNVKLGEGLADVETQLGDTTPTFPTTPPVEPPA
jgi:hypothetical protein